MSSLSNQFAGLSINSQIMPGAKIRLLNDDKYIFFGFNADMNLVCAKDNNFNKTFIINSTDVIDFVNNNIRPSKKNSDKYH
jgi:hypothetical protein